MKNLREIKMRGQGSIFCESGRGRLRPRVCFAVHNVDLVVRSSGGLALLPPTNPQDLPGSAPEPCRSRREEAQYCPRKNHILLTSAPTPRPAFLTLFLAGRIREMTAIVLREGCQLRLAFPPERRLQPAAPCRHRTPAPILAFLILFLAACLSMTAAENGGLRAGVPPSATAGVEFFEKKIRPLLAEQCYKCHSAESEKLKGKLLLDSQEGLLKGGESGPVVVPGDPERSLLIKAVRYTDKDLQMPPKNKKLSEHQISDLTVWVKMGAPWPEEDKSKSLRSKRGGFEITDKDRAYWAFQPIRRPFSPAVKQQSWPANPIDTFVLIELEAKGLSPNPPATKRELLRRVYFDLIGLPPTPEQAAAFEADRSPKAYEKLIDHLLSLPQYGERWARHWLDVARFAQSNGYEVDGEKPLAWRYRDYVIKALNEDKPYNRFVLEQIAGDELPDANPEAIIATGFQRLGVWDAEPDDKRMADFDELDDIVSTTSTAFLGLTMGCARCHEHKFDPISQADYYQFISFFRNVRPYEGGKTNLDASDFAPLALPEKVKQWRQDWQAKVKPLEAELKSAPENQKKPLKEKLERLKDESPPFEWALAVRERGGQPLPTHILVRGNAASPGAEVQPAFLTVLGGQKPALPACGPDTASTGRRLALAEWIASPQNPLTARVMVNRLWQHHFGKGIVKTTTDFGRAGVPPTHPKLLDWLAAEFIEQGWSLKKMHKLILLSNTYRMSSRSQNADADKVDPGNDLLWRQNLRRLEAEAVHDSILQISGQLNPTMGGRGFFPHLGGEVLAGASRPGLGWEKCSPEDQSRRSIYTYIRRTMAVPVLENFDYSNTTSPLGERPVTTVAPQALMLLNDEFMQRQAAALAGRLTSEAGRDRTKQVRRGYRLALNRDPNKTEQQAALDFLRRQTRAAEAIQSRLTFRPDVPNSLSVEYMKQLEPPEFLIGPRLGWSYHRGRWSGAYEGIRTVERQRGPFALCQAESGTDIVVQATLVLDRAAEFASLLLRATADGDEQRGYEVVFDPRQQRVAALRHGKELTSLAETAASVPVRQPLSVKIELNGARVRVWLGGLGEPALDVVDPHPVSGRGQVGVRTWGAPLNVDGLVLTSGTRKLAINPGAAASKDSMAKKDRLANAAERQALESFCLLLFNLNELIYVD